MTQAQILNWVVGIAVSVAVVTIGFTFFYLRYVREKIRHHRDVRKTVNDASKSYPLFVESGTHARQR
jgi:hypothetical protein